MINAVLSFLDANNIKYELFRHPAVVSVEDSKNIVHIPDCCSYKSLLVKDKKSPRYFMIVLPFDKRADMRFLASYVCADKFEFASQDKLIEFLGVKRGSVSPFCFLNQSSVSVGLMLDRQILSANRVRFHPTDNTATVALTSSDFLTCVSLMNKEIIWVN
ncbi:MAG: YbaK/EbsC family protein [Clostridia bacterium]